MRKIDSGRMYDTYYGHPVEHLQHIIDNKSDEITTIVYLAGDSSLDNKHWIPENERLPVSSKISKFMTREYAKCKPDVAYWVNRVSPSYILCMNCAVEEAKISTKINHGLNAQDILIRDNITKDDVLVISIGGNDVALASDISTILAMGCLLYITTALPKWYLLHKFKTQLREYIEKLTTVTQPKTIILCSIYYPCKYGNGWSTRFLDRISYDTNPELIHQFIDDFHEYVIDGLVGELDNVHSLKLSDILDWETSEHYISRVEPSSTGGKCIAKEIIQIIKQL